MNIQRCITVACLILASGAPAWASQPLPDELVSPEALLESAGIGDCQQDGTGAISCQAVIPAPTDIDQFVQLVDPPCAATSGMLTDLPSGYDTFVTTASQQYSFAVVRVVGLAGCPNMCGCGACIGTMILGYPVAICSACMACCKANEAASCSCQAPQIWQFDCSCGGDLTSAVEPDSNLEGDDSAEALTEAPSLAGLEEVPRNV